MPYGKGIPISIILTHSKFFLTFFAIHLDIFNCGISSLKKDEQCKAALDKVCICDEEIEKLFNGNNELLATYEKAASAHLDLNDAQSEFFFKKGFTFGVALGMEIAEFDD